MASRKKSCLALPDPDFQSERRSLVRPGSGVSVLLTALLDLPGQALQVVCLRYARRVIDRMAAGKKFAPRVPVLPGYLTHHFEKSLGRNVSGAGCCDQNSARSQQFHSVPRQPLIRFESAEAF